MAHLSAGASLGAVMNGWSIDTTVGFTALDEWPMGMRRGIEFISGADGRVPVWVIATDEKLIVVKQTIESLGGELAFPCTLVDGALA